MESEPISGKACICHRRRKMVVMVVGGGGGGGEGGRHRMEHIVSQCT